MNTDIIAKKIIRLRDKDEALRNELIKKGALSDGYNQEMEKLHNSNAEELSKIIDIIGYPTPGKIGKKASKAAWLIIQHSIGLPDFMRKCAKSLEKAINDNKADPIDLAYLTDRIAVFEGRSQLYGTQFDWDKNGEMSPYHFDDLAKVNHRRKTIGLNTLEKQTQIMREQAEHEKQVPPPDIEERKQKYNEWRKKVGWIK